MESKLISLALGFCKDALQVSPRCFMTRELPQKTSISTYLPTKCKTAKESRCFLRKANNRNSLQRRFCSDSSKEAARPRRSELPREAHQPLSPETPQWGPGPWASVAVSVYSVPLLPGSNGFSALPRLSLKRVLPSTTEPGCHLTWGHHRLSKAT